MVVMITSEAQLVTEEIKTIGIREDLREHHLAEDQGTGMITQDLQTINLKLFHKIFLE